jgi:hypothetical protein
VKQKGKAGRPDIDAFEAMMMREDCEKGFFVSFDYSSDALQEIESFFKRSHKVIVALTVQEILDEHIAKKLMQRLLHEAEEQITCWGCNGDAVGAIGGADGIAAG